MLDTLTSLVVKAAIEGEVFEKAQELGLDVTSEDLDRIAGTIYQHVFTDIIPEEAKHHLVDLSDYPGML